MQVRLLVFYYCEHVIHLRDYRLKTQWVSGINVFMVYLYNVSKKIHYSLLWIETPHLQRYFVILIFIDTKLTQETAK